MAGTIKVMREKIKRYEDAFRNNEMMTRYALVDPLLREMGWDLSDPGMVVPEEDLVKSAGKTDYTMFCNMTGRPRTLRRSGTADDAVFLDAPPVMVVEVKKLEDHLDSAVVMIAHYMETRGTRYGVLTDGRRWRIYCADPSTKTEGQRPSGTAPKGKNRMAELNAAVRAYKYLRVDGTAGKNLMAEFDIMENSVETIISTAAIFGRDAI